MQGLGDWLDLIFPRACALCRAPLVDPEERGLCSNCFRGLSPIENGCSRCGAPLREVKQLKRRKNGNRTRGCQICGKTSFAMLRVFAFSVYTGSAIRIARKMKESQHEALAEQMGRCVATWLLNATPFAIEHYDALIPIPQHWFRRLAVRYNQSETFARGIAAHFGCPVEDGWVQRTRWTPKQGMKTIAERRENMHRAFEIPAKYSQRVQGRRFLLVDDVMTSGATLDQAAWALKQRGALIVDAVVFARGLGAAKTATRRSV